jgi:hypothetical protein
MVVGRVMASAGLHADHVTAARRVWSAGRRSAQRDGRDSASDLQPRDELVGPSCHRRMTRSGMRRIDSKSRCMYIVPSLAAHLVDHRRSDPGGTVFKPHVVLQGGQNSI